MPNHNSAALDSEASSDHYLVSANGRLGSPPRSDVTEVERILRRALEAPPERGLVLHFHGGLVDREYALKNIAAPLTHHYANAGAYPLFFVWESGFTEAIWNNKRDILRDPAFRELVKKVSEWVLKKVSPSGGVSFRGAGGTPIDEEVLRSEYDRWFDGNRTSPPVEESDIAGDSGAKTRSSGGVPDEDALTKEIAKNIPSDQGFVDVMEEAFYAATPSHSGITTTRPSTKEGTSQVYLSPIALDEMFPPTDTTGAEQVKTRGLLTWIKVAAYVAKLVIAVVKRFRDDRDHGVYCTIVEEVLRSAYGHLIGATVWNAMKKDTLDSFGDSADACGRLVVEQLLALETKGIPFKRITLVGHSTGAIYICNFLDAAKKVGLKAPISVVFLAPAITCERFSEALDSHEETYLNDFRMFAMRDIREVEDQMLKPLYTRSLLYFVSGLLEGNNKAGAWSAVLDMPLVGMERFFTSPVFGTDTHVQRVWQFLNAVPERVVWSPTLDAAPGLNSDSQTHGGFDNDQATLTSLAHLIRA